MRVWGFLSILLVLFGSASCSYEEKRKTEVAVEQSVERFHEQLNHEQYHDIYSESDMSLKNRIDEVEFTRQLQNAHEQLGTTSGKAYVFVKDSVWRGLGKTLGRKREIISHGNSPQSDLIHANERFVWAVEDNQPKLVSYDF